MNLIEIVHQLRLAKGSNAKLKILQEHTDNDYWKKFLVATYDMRVTYGVSAPSTFDFDESHIDFHLFDCLEDLSSRSITGNFAKKLVKDLSSIYGEIPRLVLNRSIKAGVSVGIINKAYPGLIPIFKTMKGKDIPIIKYPVISSIKYDGVKVFAFVQPDKVSLTSSSGSEFKLLSLENDMQYAAYGVYEGELIHKEGRQVHRPVISGQLNSLLAGTKNNIEDYTYVIYDYVTAEEWDEKNSYTSYIDRQCVLASIFETALQDSMYIKQIDNVYLQNEQEVIEYFEDLISRGYEGSMHRYAEDVYMWTGDKRTDRLIKKKAIKGCVLKCYEVIPHSNPAKGNIGSLRCSGTINDKHAGRVDIDVNVGSGLTKYDIQFSEERYIGEEIEIVYNVVTKSNNKYSLFLPRYKRIVGGI